MPIRVYVASSFTNRAQVREIHNALIAKGMQPTSSWANAEGTGPEGGMTNATAARIIEQNDLDLTSSDLVFVVATDISGETFAEARMATMLGIPVLWTGRFILSAYRDGVTRFSSVQETLAFIDQASV